MKNDDATKNKKQNKKIKCVKSIITQPKWCDGSQ